MKYWVVVIHHKTGEIITGTINDDGIQDLWPVETKDGVKYVSVLDEVVKKVEV